MSIICRQGDRSDLPRLLEIEASAIPGYAYLEDAQDILFDESTGEMIVAEEDGFPIGFGRFTLQEDGAAWLEILRVHKDHQRKGCGTAIWKRYMELAESHHVPVMRMYTGDKNVGSRTLAERNGLYLGWRTFEGVLTREQAEIFAAAEEVGEDNGFVRVSDACETAWLMEPLRGDTRGYVCTNRTYYEMNEPLYRYLTENYEVWQKGASVAVTGARFLRERGLNLIFFGGDRKACIRQAAAQLLRSGLPRLVVMISADREDIKKELEDAGFVFAPSGILMLERRFL